MGEAWRGGNGLDLRGKIALVTGGGKGIGRAIALRFARARADLVLVARTQKALRVCLITRFGKNRENTRPGQGDA